jgi:hypothetical protein
MCRLAKAAACAGFGPAYSIELVGWGSVDALVVLTCPVARPVPSKAASWACR